ncbi:MAG TPA: hypothetical protein PLW55_05170 [Leptospiraceae bacterium]|nr:hypothetical protein [Leptospiraceae bacterium]
MIMSQCRLTFLKTGLPFVFLFFTVGLYADPPEWRKDMPWFDNPKEDYRAYGPDDIKPYLEKPKERSRSGFALPDLTQLVYAVAAILAGAAIYLIVRRILERRPAEEEVLEETPEMKVSVVVDLPEAHLPDQDLVKVIEQLLAAGNFRRAGMLLFQLACNRLKAEGLLDFHEYQTPREIASTLNTEREGEILAQAGKVFEDCAYRPEEPSGAAVISLKERVFSLGPA